MRGLTVIDDFIEFKHIRLPPGPIPACASLNVPIGDSPAVARGEWVRMLRTIMVVIPEAILS